MSKLNNLKSKIKQFFCNHKEEECIQAIPLPYSHYNTKCCFKCKKCGYERWINWYWNNEISEYTPIPTPPMNITAGEFVRIMKDCQIHREDRNIDLNGDAPYGYGEYENENTKMD